MHRIDNSTFINHRESLCTCVFLKHAGCWTKQNSFLCSRIYVVRDGHAFDRASEYEFSDIKFENRQNWTKRYCALTPTSIVCSYKINQYDVEILFNST